MIGNQQPRNNAIPRDGHPINETIPGDGHSINKAIPGDGHSLGSPFSSVEWEPQPRAHVLPFSSRVFPLPQNVQNFPPLHVPSLNTQAGPHVFDVGPRFKRLEQPQVKLPNRHGTNVVDFQGSAGQPLQPIVDLLDRSLHHLRHRLPDRGGLAFTLSFRSDQHSSTLFDGWNNRHAHCCSEWQNGRGTEELLGLLTP